jgi:hypothetical protein
MSYSEEEMDRAVVGLGTRTLTGIPSDEAGRLLAAIENRFSRAPGKRWIWEHLSGDSVSRRFEDDRAFARLPAVVPDLAEPLLFLPGSNEPVAHAYRGTIDAIADVIGECSAFEYLIAPNDLAWLICENHHGVLVAVGEPVATRLRAL